MRRSHRLIAAALLVAFSGALAGCSSSLGTNFDPTDLLDWLDTKKKLPGERKPVFPNGVPGVDQGVPKDLYKNNVERQQQLDQQNAATQPPPPEPPPPAAAGKKGSKGKQPAIAAAAPADQPAAEPDGEAETAGQEDATPAAPPPPKPKKIVRKRTTAPPPDQPAAQSAQPFPAPLPGGTFTR
jgi:hypothetical protein